MEASQTQGGEGTLCHMLQHVEDVSNADLLHLVNN
jgi:hypothetical protein